MLGNKVLILFRECFMNRDHQMTWMRLRDGSWFWF